jgi:hypothetical protein
MDSPLSGLIASKILQLMVQKFKTYSQEGAVHVWPKLRAELKSDVIRCLSGPSGYPRELVQCLIEKFARAVWDKAAATTVAQIPRLALATSDQEFKNVYNEIYYVPSFEIEEQIEKQVSTQVLQRVKDMGWGDGVVSSEVGWLGPLICDPSGYRVLWETTQGSFRGLPGYYEFLFEICKLEGCSKFAPLVTLTKESAEAWFFSEVAIFSEKPTVVCLNSKNELHNQSEMALAYADGLGGYFLNGVRVNEEIVKLKANDFTKEVLLRQRDDRVYREIINKIGVAKANELCSAQSVQRILENHSNHQKPEVD